MNTGTVHLDKRESSPPGLCETSHPSEMLTVARVGSICYMHVAKCNQDIIAEIGTSRPSQQDLGTVCRETFALNRSRPSFVLGSDSMMFEYFPATR